MPPSLPPPQQRAQVLRPQPKIHDPIKLTKEYMDNRVKLTRGEFEASQKGAVQARFGKIEGEIKNLQEGQDQNNQLLRELIDTLKKKE